MGCGYWRKGGYHETRIAEGYVVRFTFRLSVRALLLLTRQFEVFQHFVLGSGGSGNKFGVDAGGRYGSIVVSSSQRVRAFCLGPQDASASATTCLVMLCATARTFTPMLGVRKEGATMRGRD